ncbi:hypothetical protein BHM03_00039055 [Ensete ventricosum]|nr:hypothetical protein BHM03_00039055 [Ensete ventricosum]
MIYRYLAALISQSFLDIGSVSRILDSIMKLCLQFCWIIEQYESNPNLSELEHITEVIKIFLIQTLYIVRAICFCARLPCGSLHRTPLPPSSPSRDRRLQPAATPAAITLYSLLAPQSVAITTVAPLRRPPLFLLATIAASSSCPKEDCRRPPLFLLSSSVVGQPSAAHYYPCRRCHSSVVAIPQPLAAAAHPRLYRSRLCHLSSSPFFLVAASMLPLPLPLQPLRPLLSVVPSFPCISTTVVANCRIQRYPTSSPQSNPPLQ